MEHILENPLFIDEISISGIIGIKGYDDSGTDTSYAAKAVKSKNAKGHAVTQLSHTFPRQSQYS
jgi:hypothetical protein